MEEKLKFLETQGINIKNGMKYADESIEFYEQLISIFVEEYEGKRKRAQKEKGESTYTVLVHGLKNSARYLGADMLADMAYEHEKASKAGDIIYIEDNLESLLFEWEKTVEIFQKMYN